MSAEDNTNRILNEKYKVNHEVEYPTLIPYTDQWGNAVSPFTDAAYNKLPRIYRSMDEQIGRPLYRFLQSLIDSGYADIATDTDSLLNLVDPQTCPDEFLPYYYKSMGLEWFPDMITEERGTYYLRTFLSNIGEVYKRRGTESVIKYIAKTLTEMDVDLAYMREYDENRVTKARTLWINVLAETEEQVANLEISSKVIKRFIDSQVPYFLTTIVTFAFRYDITIPTYTAVVNGTKLKSDVPAIPDLPEDLFLSVELEGGGRFITLNEESLTDPTDLEDEDGLTIEASDGAFTVQVRTGDAFSVLNEEIYAYLIPTDDEEEEEEE